ncbi:MAG TPA: hypothetical protein VEC56_00640 [Candidatus Krumholzibacteria bacterium]|nr:hypothetical protein [Candidatus Krumholzibacteria bacterium]
MRLAGLLLTQALVMLVAGTVLTLVYPSLPATAGGPATLGVVAFGLVGIVVGSFAIKSSVKRVAGLLGLVVIGVLNAAYLAWLYRQVIGSRGDEDFVSVVYLPYLWAAVTLLGAIPLASARVKERRRLKSEFRPTEAGALAFIEANGLFATEAELRKLAARPKGLKCGICRNPYSGDEHLGSGWKERWVRCPRSPEHVFHARDFEYAEWRCPIDKSLLYEPKGP